MFVASWLWRTAMLQLSDDESRELQKLMRRAEKPHVRMKAAALWNLRRGRGRPARAQEAEVEQVLRQSPRSFGLAQTRWTLRALSQVVPSLRGFSEMGVWKVLHRMDLRYKRGQPHLHSPDPEYEEKRGGWFRPSTRPVSLRGGCGG